MSRFFYSISLCLSIISAGLLLLAYLSPYVNPNTWYIPSLLGYLFPYLLILNVIICLWWLIQWKKCIWINLSILILGTHNLYYYYAFNNQDSNIIDEDVKIMSYNVRFFNVIWGKSSFADISKFIIKSNNDIVALQEWTLPNGNSTTFTNRYKYSYTNGYLAIFSKSAIIRKGKVDLGVEKSASCIFCDVVRKKDTIRIYNIHLQSYKLSSKAQSIIKGESNNVQQKEVSSIAYRIIDANRKRAEQSKIVAKHIENCKYKIVICGDFNDTPLSYSYRTIKNNKDDCFLEKGNGTGSTFMDKILSYRIDYILVSKSIQCLEYSKEECKFSDHYPISVKLKI